MDDWDLSQPSQPPLSWVAIKCEHPVYECKLQKSGDAINTHSSPNVYQTAAKNSPQQMQNLLPIK